MGHGLVDVGVYFSHGTFGTVDHGSRHRLVFPLCAVARHVILGTCRLFRGYHGIVVGVSLVAFLCRHHTLFEEAVHAVVGFLGNLQSSLRLLPHLVGGLQLLGACAAFRLLMLCLCGSFGCFSLSQFGCYVGSFEDGKGVALVHLLSFLDAELQDASRHFARYTVFVGFSLSLNDFRGPSQREVSHQGYHSDDEHQGDECQYDILVLLFLCKHSCRLL